MRVSAKKLQNFKRDIRKYYKKNRRDLPWRRTTDPYLIVVSEVMLQQTQVSRVVQKFAEFTKTFPTFKSLARASKSDILKLWQGMGYNRRALYLKALAEAVEREHSGRLPDDPKLLIKLPSIGRATTGSIAAFVFNKPSVFVESNIRRVFIHFFFKNKRKVTDRDILTLVEKTLDKKRPKEWYWALMDYGTMLAKKVPNPNRNSLHYIKQAPFEGSNRQIRGAILKLLLSKRVLSKKALSDSLSYKDEKLSAVLNDLVKEGFLIKNSHMYKVQ